MTVTEWIRGMNIDMSVIYIEKEGEHVENKCEMIFGSRSRIIHSIN